MPRPCGEDRDAGYVRPRRLGGDLGGHGHACFCLPDRPRHEFVCAGRPHGQSERDARGVPKRHYQRHCRSGSTIIATYTENVYRDPTNPYCGTCLDWVVKVSNAQNSTDPIERVTVSNFTSYLTDIGVDSNGAPGLTNNGTVAPNNVERNNSGIHPLVGLQFLDRPSNSTSLHGQTSVLLEIATNATDFKPGTISVQNGVAGSGPALGPIPEVPFVPALGLMGGVAIGGFAWRRRRRSRRLAKALTGSGGLSTKGPLHPDYGPVGIATAQRS